MRRGEGLIELKDNREGYLVEPALCPELAQSRTSFISPLVDGQISEMRSMNILPNPNLKSILFT
jgi:hypothetical protein